MEQSIWWNGATKGGNDGGTWFWEDSMDSMVDDSEAGWAPDEPQPDTGDCALMKSNDGYGWSAAPCDTPASFICQLDGINLQREGLDRCPDGWFEARGFNLGCVYLSQPQDSKLGHQQARDFCSAKHSEVSGHPVVSTK